MKIMRNDGADFNRIKDIQSHFPGSPVLANIYKRLEDIWLKPKTPVTKSKQDELQELILAKDQDAVKNFIAQNQDISAWINLYCANGHTVFISATLSSSVEVMQMLLNAGASVNIPNMQMGFLPISAAINNGNYDKLKLLLENNADVLTTCGPRKLSPDRVYLYKFEAATPLTLALDNYRENPSENNAKIVKLLLQYGAGTGHKFEFIFLEILQGEVAIGATLPQNCDVPMVTSIRDFVLKTRERDYPHWHKIFKNLLTNPILANNRRLQQLVAQVCEESQPLVRSTMFWVIQIAHRSHQKLGFSAVHIAKERHADFKTFFDAISNRNYGKALRCACTSKDPVALELVELILEYKDKLTFDINETAGADKVNALHIAAGKGNKLAYDLLIANGADDSIKAGNGLTASEILENTPSKQSSSKLAHVEKK
jgi:ankyrin repeat protein